jgi:hypothetical protein
MLHPRARVFPPLYFYAIILYIKIIPHYRYDMEVLFQYSVKIILR